MKAFFKILGVLCVFSMLVGSATAAIENTSGNTTGNTTIIKELPNKGELESFINALPQPCSINIATLEAISQHPTWPHDIWRDSKENKRLSFYYKDNSSDGFSSVYYDDNMSQLPNVCGMVFKLIEPYYGLNVTVQESIELPENVTVNTFDNTSVPESIKGSPEPVVIVKNENGTINSQGNGNILTQLWIDISELKNCTINVYDSHFWGK